jgi:hypothetical protein
MGCLSAILQLFGIALILSYFVTDFVSSIFVPIFGVACFIVGRLARSAGDPSFHTAAGGAGDPGFHMAARRGDIAEMESWLARGQSIESRSNNYTTPLHWTAFKGHVEATRFLLDRGADVNARDKFGMTPLKHAEMEGHMDVVALLKERGGTG